MSCQFIALKYVWINGRWKEKKKRPSDKKIILFWVGIHFIQECISTWNSVNEIEKKKPLLFLDFIIGKDEWSLEKKTMYFCNNIYCIMVGSGLKLAYYYEKNNEIMLGKESIYKNEFEVWIATKSYFIRLVIVITLDLEWMNWMEWVFNEIQWFLVFS